VGVVRRQRQLARVREGLALELDRPPTDDEVAAAARLSEADMAKLRDVAQTVASLDRHLGTDEDLTLGDLIADDGPTPFEHAEQAVRRRALNAALDELPVRERHVLWLRYGLAGGEPEPLREVGRRLGLTPERVRQIERAALSRLGRASQLAPLRAA
jgi:RNA polymerase primary sigma factor